LAGYNYTTQIIEFLSTYVLSRLLLPEEYGFVALITVFTGFMAMFVDAGLSFAVIRSDYGKRYHKAISNLSFLIGVVLFFIMLALAYPITLFYENRELLVPTIILGSNFILKSVNVVPLAILTKELRFSQIGLVKLLGTILTISLMILLAYLGFSYWALIIPVMIQTVFNGIMYAVMSGFYFRFFPWIYSRLAIRTTRSLIVNITGFNLINYWARHADNLVIGKVYGAADLGIYNRAYKLLKTSMNLTTNLFGKVLFPSLKQLKSEGGDVKKEYESILGIISIITFPLGAFMILFAEPFVRFMWGENWMEVADFLPYFGLLILLQTLISTVGNIYIIYDKEKVLFRIGGISAIAMIAAILFGAVFSTLHVARFYALSYVLVTVPLNIVLGFVKTLKFSPGQVIRFWGPKIILFLGIFVSVWVDRYIITSSLLFLYLLHILVFQWKDVLKIVSLIRNRVGRKKRKSNPGIK
jgi:O-antigen/teichoic acid export membrane protein